MKKTNSFFLQICLIFLILSFTSLTIAKDEKEEGIVSNRLKKIIRCSRAPEIIDAIRERLKENPDDEELLTHLAFIADYCGLWNTSIEANKKLLEIGVEDSAVYNNLGRAYLNVGNLKEAEIYLKKSLEIQPDNIFAFHNLGLLLKYKGDFEGSIQNFKKAIEISPNWPETHYDFGNTYLAMKDYDSAIKCYEKAMEFGLENVDIFKNLGLAYLGKDNKREALSYFKKALKLSPENQTLKELIQMTGEAIRKRQKLEIAPE